MRQRHRRHCLDFRHLQHAKIRLPLVKPIQRIIVRAEILRQRLSSYRLLKHPTQRQSIDYSPMNAKPNNTACKLVHHDQNPMDIPLQVGAVTERVVVEADAAMVETHSTGIGSLVDQQRVVELPLNGRTLTQLIYLGGVTTPGVSLVYASRTPWLRTTRK